MPQSKSTAREAGFSLIELVMGLAIITIVGTLSLTAFAGYGKTQVHKAAVREAVAILRNTQIRAVTEASAFQCRVDATSVPHTIKIYRDGTSPPAAATITRTYTLNPALRFVNVAFQHSDVTFPQTSCLFFARGSASQGSFAVERADNGREYKVSVEGLTARVSYEGA